MSDDRPEPPALKSLHRSFAIALSNEKFSSAGKAHLALKSAKSAIRKREIINAHFDIWREGSGSAIRRFFPQYIDLGMAYPDHLESEVVKWSEENAWIPLCGQCGVQKYGDLNAHAHRSHSVIWWLAVAIDQNFGVNVPGEPRWCAPKWLARNLRETDKLIADWSHRLSARFYGVLDEEMEAARVRVAIATSLRNPSTTGSAQGHAKSTPQQYWRDLQETFRKLQRDHDSHRWDDGLVAHAPHLPGDEWEHISQSHSPREIMLFEVAAERGAIGLAYKGERRSAISFWLNLVKQNTKNFKSILRNGDVELPDQGFITRIAEASADYCCQLENNAQKLSNLEDAGVAQQIRSNSRYEEQKKQLFIRRPVSHKFDKEIGKVIYEARERRRAEGYKTKRPKGTPTLLPEEIQKIAKLADRMQRGQRVFPLKDILPALQWKKISNHNSSLGGAAPKIDSFEQLVESRKFKQIAIQRFNRAATYYRRRGAPEH